MKYLLYLAIVISIIIAVYEVMFWGNELAFVIAVLSLILAFYGYVLLKCCCYTAAKKKR
jgi:TRAP-type C4-dicarboxylate transport system permease large subunit